MKYQSEKKSYKELTRKFMGQSISQKYINDVSRQCGDVKTITEIIGKSTDKYLQKKMLKFSMQE